jgi:fumarate hydratase class I
MRGLQSAVVELYRKAATSLPLDIEIALKDAFRTEKKGSNAQTALSAVLENVKIARETSLPICQDTGVPVFFIKVPKGISQLEIRDAVVKATKIATREIPLRPNAVDILTEKNSGDNTGVGFPIVYFEEVKGEHIIMDLMLKGSGSENVGQLYKLPVAELKAERDLDGVRKCVLEAVYKAQGKGCPPYIVGVGIGAAKDQVTRLAKEQLLRTLADRNKHSVLADLEKRLFYEINELGTGPLGLGGKTTVLGVKVGVNHRHPASYFVDVSIACWADRRARLKWALQKSKFKIKN